MTKQKIFSTGFLGATRSESTDFAVDAIPVAGWKPMLDIQTDPERSGYVLRAELLAPASLDEVFAFYSDAYNLEKLTQPEMHFRVVTEPPVEMRVGLLLDYELRVLGFPVRWQSKITAWEPQRRFADVQTKGPFRYWEHEHTFEPTDAGVIVRDQVHYGVPGGAIVHKLKVRSDIERMFAYREARQREIFGGS